MELPDTTPSNDSTPSLQQSEFLDEFTSLLLCICGFVKSDFAPSQRSPPKQAQSSLAKSMPVRIAGRKSIELESVRVAPSIRSNSYEASMEYVGGHSYMEKGVMLLLIILVDSIH